MKKKWIAVLLTVSMAAGILTGCGSGAKGGKQQAAGTESGTGGNTAENAVEEKKNGDVVTLKVAAMAFNDQSLVEDVERAANEILKDKGVALDITFINIGSWQQQTNLLLTGGSDTVDILPWYGTPLATYVNNGQALELDELLDRYGEGIKKEIPEDMLELGRVDENIYGIYTDREVANSYGIWMRKDILEETGIDPAGIKTLEDCTALFAKVKELHPDMECLSGGQAGTLQTNTWGWDQISDANNLGVMLDNGQSGEIVNLYESGEYEDYVRLMRKWYEAGYISPDVLSKSDDPSVIMRAGKLFSALSHLKPLFGEQQARITGCEIEVIELRPASLQTQTVQGMMWGISASTKHPEEAMILLNEMYTNPQLANILINGIEGKSYTYTDDGKKMINFPEGVNASNTPYTAQSWIWPNAFETPVWEPYPEDYWKQIEDFNNTALHSKALGFVPDTSEITNEITACTNVVAKYNPSLMAGAVDVDESLAQFREELKTAGIDKIIETKSKQYEEWKAKQ